MYQYYTLINIAQPSIVTQPQSDSILTDRTYTLQCIVTGSPFPNVTWIKDGVPIDYTSRVYHDLFDASLRFTNVEVGDNGTYQCIVANEEGQSISNEVVLTVQGMELLKVMFQYV